MLQSLHVHNFALIEDASVEFSAGFNIFTGETGAGKSILVDAFSIVLGGRASASFVRSGCDSFWVQAVFDCADEKIKKLLEEQEIEAEDALFLKRKVTATGKSQSSVNGVQVPLAVLKQFAGLLVDIHGQHENQALLQAKAPMFYTDAFGGTEAGHLLADYHAVYQQYKADRSALQQLEEKGAQRERLLDQLSWEIQEIEDAAVHAGEEDALKDELKLLRNSGKIMNALYKAYNGLEQENGALAQLAEIREQVSLALRYDDRLKAAFEDIDSAWIAADDARSQLKDHIENRNYDESRMTEVQERLDLLYRLQRKYGAGEETILQYLNQAKGQHALLKDLDQRIAEAKDRLTIAEKQMKQKAEEVTALRKENAGLLCDCVKKHIHDLAMPAADFRIEFSDRNEFTADGKDWMEFLFSANEGEPLQSLSQVASGGELSRLALALKTELIGISGVNTMVFDEIDTGVGGVTAQKMAEKMELISRRGQVLCITHLAQIAAFADNHICIRKETEGGRTLTKLTVLDHDGRVQELVRMTAGERVTKAAKDNAEALLQAASEFKRDNSILKSRNTVQPI